MFTVASQHLAHCLVQGRESVESCEGTLSISEEEIGRERAMGSAGSPRPR